MSVKRCQQEVDSVEFVEWFCLYQDEPFGEWRADLRAAIIAATVANSQSTKRTFQPREFMPQFGPPTVRRPPAQPLAQQRAIFEAFVQAQNASVGYSNGHTKD